MDTPDLRQAVITWLGQAQRLSFSPHAVTDAELAARPEFEPVLNAVVHAAPISEHRDLYGKVDGDWLPRLSAILGQSGLGDATRLLVRQARVPLEEIADDFVAFCTAPAPCPEDWLLLRADVPEGTRIPLGRYTLQTFTPDELRHLGPMPALGNQRPGTSHLDLLTGAPFLHTAHTGRISTRAPHWGGHRGPRAEAEHWRALLPLMLWSSEPLRVQAVFDVERGRCFGLRSDDVPTTLTTSLDRHGMEEDYEVRESGSYHVTPAQLPALKAFCAHVTARIDAVVAGTTSGRRLPTRRARRLERAARHLLRAYQRTYSDYSVWQQEADEVLLDYVIALEALMISPADEEHQKISENIRTRASALFLTPGQRTRVEEVVQQAYSARSKYVHGDKLTEHSPTHQLDQLRELRLIARQVLLRWLILRPRLRSDMGRSVGDSTREP
ncbi:hypothetical protein [Streptomyces sp. NPDC047070]|uniref:hypothetical protein n=1 Tax=Streptomyces sp. NPDC047070 TaxID=3154923 RepID=UPI003456FE66